MRFHTYGFIGLGLIGGSLARVLKRIQPDCRIMAYTRSSATTEAAKADATIDLICNGPSDPAYAECDIVFLCTPVGSNIEALKQLKDIVPASCILTDVGSVKSDIHKAVHELGLDGRFIGGHPMTGSEKSGYQHSTPHLYENSYYIITPSEGVAQEDIDAYKELATAIGALPLVLGYKQHDFATAAVSHLPHLVAAALVNTVHDLDSSDEIMKMIAAGGFKDITRIASSSPEMWEHICLSNGDNISQVMDTFLKLLTKSRDDMNSRNGKGLNDMFRDSREYRNSFSSSTPGLIKKTYRIFCDIVDESGAIATIATILAVNRINIKNIGIVHNREFEEGVLQIEFYEEAPSLEAARILEHHRYKIFLR